MDFHIIERLGGPCRCVTLFTLALHFLHSLFSVVNYLAWVRQDRATLPMSVKHAYLSLTVVCCVFYFLGASVFYMWAWRFPEPEEIAKRRRVYGVVIHAIFCDVPIFVVETIIVWRLRFSAAIQGFTYVLACISLCYSLLRVWFFFMVRVIKFRLPSAVRLGANYPALSGVVRRDLDELDYHNGVAGMREGNVTELPEIGINEGSYAPDMIGARVGNTILLNRNAATALSDDGVTSSGGIYTPAAAAAAAVRGRSRGDAYYGPPPPVSHYATQSDRFDEVEEPPRQGYYGHRRDDMDQQGIPFRI